MDLKECQGLLLEYCIECRKYEYGWQMIFDIEDPFEQIKEKEDFLSEMREESARAGKDVRNFMLYFGACGSCVKYSPRLYNLDELDSMIYEIGELKRVISDREVKAASAIICAYNEICKKYSAEVAIGMLKLGLKELEESGNSHIPRLRVPT